MRPYPRQLVLSLLLAAALVPYFVDLDGSSIWDANEAFYVETPREMMEHGDYVIPTFNYVPRINKPVLSYWIVAGFYKVFGVSVGVERLPIAIGAAVMIITAFFLAYAAAPRGGWDAGHRIEAGLWAALGLAAAPRLMMFSRRIFIDVYISMFMGLTLLFFALSERYPGRRRLFLLLMYVAVGLGVLTKGPVAAVLPGLAFGAYLLLHGELKRLREMMVPAGILVVLAIVVPWYALVYQRHGAGYTAALVQSFFLGENVARYTQGLGVESSRGPLFYLPVVFSDSFPWSIGLFGAAAMWFADRRVRAPHVGIVDRAPERIRTLLWLWILSVVAFFSLSAAKQDLYIFPIVPAVAALAGVFFVRAAQGPGRWSVGLRLTAASIALLLGIAGAAAVYLFNGALRVYELDGAGFVGWVAAAGGLIAAAVAIGGRAKEALGVIAVALVSLNCAFVIRVLPSFERYKPVPRLSAAIRERAAPDDVIAHYNVALPSMVYYLRRPIDVMFDREQFLQRLGGDRRVFAVLSASDYAVLQPSMGVPTCVLGREQELNVKLKAVLAREPLPEVLLITNRCR